MFKTLLNSIQTKAASTTGSPFIIAVSGFGGSGKSTLATQLKHALPNSEVISIDAFATPTILQLSTDWSGFDRQRLITEVLTPTRQGQPVTYGVFEWATNAITHSITVPPTPFLIIEGCSLFHSSLKGLFNFSIWVNVSLEESTQRGIARDRANHADETWIKNWTEIWMPNERDFAAQYHPEKTADFLYTPTES